MVVTSRGESRRVKNSLNGTLPDLNRQICRLCTEKGGG
jgi:hypothetical protein